MFDVGRAIADRNCGAGERGKKGAQDSSALIAACVFGWAVAL